MFRAVVDQLSMQKTTDHTHSSLRKAVVDYMREHQANFAAFLSEEDADFSSYCTKMVRAMFILKQEHGESD